MVANSSALRAKKSAPPRAGATPPRRKTAAPRPSPSSVDHAATAIRQGIGEALERLSAIEGEVASLVRGHVSDSQAAARGAVLDLGGVIREVLAGTMAAAGESASALRLGVEGAARGIVAGVHDARGDLSGAVGEIVKTSITEGHRLGAEISGVLQFALDGMSKGMAEAGQSTAGIAGRAAKDALATASGISGLAVEAVRQVVRGTAEGMEEVARRHRAECQGASRGQAAPPDGNGRSRRS